MAITLEENEILVLKTVNSEGKAFFNDFQYPLEIGSVVTAPDWEATLECGHGLHGLPWGEGETDYLSVDPSALWLIISVNTKIDYILFVDKCKFKSGRVEFVGNRVETINELQKYAPLTARINFANQVGLDNAVQIAGHSSTQTAGDESAQITKSCASQQAGKYATQTTECASMQIAGDESAQIAKSYSTQMAGDYSIQKSGSHATQKAGSYSIQTAGLDATQTAGVYAIQIFGNLSTQIANIGTVQICRYYIDSEYKVCTRIITEKEANKPYFFEDGVWTEIESK